MNNDGLITQNYLDNGKVLYFRGMYGLGDNIYQRAFIRQFSGCFIRTPWPEIYSDLSVKCIRSDTALRTQQKNENQTKFSFYSLPKNTTTVDLNYNTENITNRNIIASFRKITKTTGPLLFDLPDYDDLYGAIPFNERIAIVRPVTLRQEWNCASRNPDPRYIYDASVVLSEMGFFVICIADLAPGKEWLIGALPRANLYLINGELSTTQLFSLYQRAACVISPVGFSLPLCIAYQTPLLVIAGGHGGHDAPDRLTSEDMAMDKIKWAIPDNYCLCTKVEHNCNKEITHFKDTMENWLYEIVL